MTTTGVCSGGVAAKIMTAVVTGDTMGPEHVQVQLSSFKISLYTWSLNS